MDVIIEKWGVMENLRGWGEGGMVLRVRVESLPVMLEGRQRTRLSRGTERERES